MDEDKDKKIKGLETAVFILIGIIFLMLFSYSHSSPEYSGVSHVQRP